MKTLPVRTMLSVIALMLTTLVVSVSANAAEATRTRWVCNEYDRGSEKLLQRTVVLAQEEDGVITDGRSLKFSLEQFVGAKSYSEIVVTGRADVEDVSFAFTSDDGKTKFHIYLDELAESSMSVDGEEAGDFVCRRAVSARDLSPSTLVCNEYSEGGRIEQLTVVLSRTDGVGLKEGETMAFEFEQFMGAATYTGKTVVGTGEVEDVNLWFTSTDETVGFHVYLDEVDQSSLSINGESRGDFVCR